LRRFTENAPLGFWRRRGGRLFVDGACARVEPVRAPMAFPNNTTLALDCGAFRVCWRQESLVAGGLFAPRPPGALPIRIRTWGSGSFATWGRSRRAFLPLRPRCYSGCACFCWCPASSYSLFFLRVCSKKPEVNEVSRARTFSVVALSWVLGRLSPKIAVAIQRQAWRASELPGCRQRLFPIRCRSASTSLISGFVFPAR